MFVPNYNYINLLNSMKIVDFINLYNPNIINPYIILLPVGRLVGGLVAGLSVNIDHLNPIEVEIEVGLGLSLAIFGSIYLQ